MRVEQLTLEEWGSRLPTTGFEVFHLPEALAVLDQHADADLRLFGGFEGGELVGMTALFVRELPVGKVVLSSPMGTGVPYTGPVLTTTREGVAQYEANRRFLQGVLETVDVDCSTLVSIRCGPEYRDPRPGLWDGLTVVPKFTYHVEVEDRTPDELLKTFSRNRRREIQRIEESEVTVERGGADASRRVFEETKARFAQQDEPFEMEWAYVRDLLTALGDRARVYVAREGKFLGGVTVLYSDDTALFWQGGTRNTTSNEADGASINSVLHWRIMKDIAEDPPVASVRRYDLMDGMQQRLARYKASFNPQLRPFYVLRSARWKTALAKRAHRLATAVT